MSTPFRLEIVTPNRHLFTGDVNRIILRTTEGDMGILARMEPTVAPLAIGALRLQIGDEEKIASVTGGFVNVEKDGVTIITDASEWALDIDKARALAAKGRAEERLAQKDAGNVDFTRAKAALMRAINRIRVAERVGL